MLPESLAWAAALAILTLAPAAPVTSPRCGSTGSGSTAEAIASSHGLAHCLCKPGTFCEGSRCSNRREVSGGGRTRTGWVAEGDTACPDCSCHGPRGSLLAPPNSAGLAAPFKFDEAVALSQLGEDRHLNGQFFKGQRGGVFVEMGALDGLKYSNSYAFEQALGWSGVLIEANPASCAKLFRNRPAPTTLKLCTAVSDDFAPITFSKGNDPAVFAVQAVLDSMPGKYKQKFHQEATVVTVPSAPLGYLLRAAGVKYIDLFSLDVEGWELKVLMTMEWSIPVRVWCVETQLCLDDSVRCANANATVRDIDQLMSAHDYVKTPWTEKHWGMEYNTLYVWRGTWTPSAYSWQPLDLSPPETADGAAASINPESGGR